jgi:DNA-binding protein YbaB
VTNPEHIAALKARLQKIKENPQQALFSEFKGVSRTGAITVWVDMLGRQKRVHIAPNTVREGDEQWLTDEINSAYKAANKAATFLDFDVAEFAQELRDLAALPNRAPEQSAPSPSTAVPSHKRRPQGRTDDDEWFDDFTVQR